MESQVVILKMIDGTEILTTVAENAGSYFCRDILQLVTDVDERGQGRKSIFLSPSAADCYSGLHGLFHRLPF